MEILETDLVILGTGGANIVYGDTPDYNWKAVGSALGFALNSGRIAGENAARYIAG